MNSLNTSVEFENRFASIDECLDFYSDGDVRIKHVDSLKSLPTENVAYEDSIREYGAHIVYDGEDGKAVCAWNDVLNAKLEWNHAFVLLVYRKDSENISDSARIQQLVFSSKEKIIG